MDTLIYNFVIISALCVCSHLAQDFSFKYFNNITAGHTKDPKNTPLEENYRNSSSLLKEMPPMDLICYVAHMKCDSKTYFRRNSNGSNEVCAHQKVHGLVNFQSICDIALQNCLYKVKHGAEVKDRELFFYNNKNRPCQYYLKIGETLRNAISLYYVDNLNLGQFWDEFEKVDDENKYDFLDLVYA